MDWFSLIIGLVIGFIIGKFWGPVSASLKVLQTELQKATANNQQLAGGQANANAPGNKQ